MKIRLISDNIDTQMGLRLAGIEGVVVHEQGSVLAALESYRNDPDVAIILMTTKIVNLCPEVISGLKLHSHQPLLVEIPDRHGSAKIGEIIDSYISAAVGTKLGGE
ncbi:MAG: V-type ATP synthase subunit F [Erysipelotrichaceae bacterium]|jgi:V/A-type H+-transporting ATPase subunit F|nr:V-type ATP synthase subunit F [Erysipelotrichaceae bacterium]